MTPNEQLMFNTLISVKLLEYAAYIYWNKGINVVYDDGKVEPMAVRYNIFDLGQTYNLSVEHKGLVLVDDFIDPLLEDCPLHGPALFWNNLHVLHINRLRFLVDLGPNVGQLKHLLPKGLYDHGDRKMYSPLLDFLFGGQECS